MEKQLLVNYSLAIMPPEPIAEQVKELKQLLKKEIGKSYGSVNSDAHISLDSFDSLEESYPQVLEEYKRRINALPVFDIRFSGYGHFEEFYPAFFVQIDDESKESIRNLYANIRGGFDQSVRKQFMRKWTDESKEPHMTIGRRLTMEWIQLAYNLFPFFEKQFTCKQLSVRKYNEKLRQYEVVDTIDLGTVSRQDGSLWLFDR